MRRVLIIASDYPPKLSIASRRPYGLSKYLPEYGWEPVVLTISEKARSKNDHRDIKVIESDLLAKPHFIENFLDMVHKREINNEKFGDAHPIQHIYCQSSSEKYWITKLRNILFYPDRYFISWYRNAVKSYFKIAKDLPVTAIISTAKPFTTHLIAHRIKNKTRVPWVADFRDLWPHWKIYKSDSHYYNHRNFLDRLLLRWVLSSADALVAVNDPSKQLLSKRFGRKRIYNIQNGFDPEEYRRESQTNNKLFLLTYTGHVRTDRLDPEILFKAISQLIKRGNIDSKLIKVRFYGEITEKLWRDIEKYQIKDIVEAKGIRRPRGEIVVKQMESSLLIVFAALDLDEIGTAPGKIYEYLAAKRPILAIGKPVGVDVLSDILNETRAGVYARTLEEIKQNLVLQYNQFIKKGTVEYHGIPDRIDQFSYKKMASKYAEVLAKITRVHLKHDNG